MSMTCNDMQLKFMIYQSIVCQTGLPIAVTVGKPNFFTKNAGSGLMAWEVRKKIDAITPASVLPFNEFNMI